MSANHTVYAMQKMYMRPHVARQKIIDDIIAKSRKEISAPRFYVNIFSPDFLPPTPSALPAVKSVVGRAMRGSLAVRPETDDGDQDDATRTLRTNTLDEIH